MTTPMTITFQIDSFCTCEGCLKKVKKTLGKLDDVKLLATDPEEGKFTISTTKDPEVIKYALKDTFPKKNITLSQEMNHSHPLPSSSNPRNLTAQENPIFLATPQGNDDVQDIAKEVVTMSQVKGLESVEYTQSNTFKFNFTNRHNQPTLHNLRGSNGIHLEDVPAPLPPAPPPPAPPPPQTNIEPSAPPFPTIQDQVYGFPPKFYGF